MFEKMASSAFQVLWVGLLLGAGLPALFALGVKSLAYGVGGDAEVSHESGHPVGKVVGYLLFAIVAAAVLLGITIIVASGLNKAVEFHGIIPTLVAKH